MHKNAIINKVPLTIKAKRPIPKMVRVTICPIGLRGTKLHRFFR